MKRAAAYLLLFLWAASAFGSDQCKGNPALVGACFVVRGRLSVYNGNPVYRIWRIGTDRMLGLAGAHIGDPEIMPRDLGCGPHCDVYADFLVCPFTKSKPGVMQRVCIEGASKIVRKHDQ